MGVRTRIRSALSYKKPLLWVLVAVLVAAVVLAVCFFTSPQDTQGRSEGVTYLPGIQGVYGESSLDDFGTELVSFRRDVSGGFTVQLRFADRSLPSGTRGVAVMADWTLERQTEAGGYAVVREGMSPAWGTPYWLMTDQYFIKTYLFEDSDFSSAGIYRLTVGLTVPEDSAGGGRREETAQVTFHFDRDYYDFRESPVPDDFALSLEFQIGKTPNRMDTFTGTVQKDLVTGTPSAAVCPLELTAEETAELWRLVEYYGILNMPEDQTGSGGIAIEPSTAYSLTVRAKGRVVTVHGDSAGSMEADREGGSGVQADYYSCVYALMRFLYGTEAWQSLPEVRGGYD